ncbi:MAG: hypothetical protein J5636_09205, partial [Clostridiales bacterium]|nr:hypothetical protein [Clostridiales bacterium]
EAEVLLSKLEELRISSGTEEDAKPVDYPTLITIKFEDTYKTTYAYLGDGKWKYSSGYFNKTSLFTFTEEEKYMPLVDEIIAIASLPQIQNFRSIPDAFEADFSHTYDQSKMAKELGKNYQAVTYYVKEDAYWGTILNGNKDEFIYYEGLTITSIMKDGQTFFEHADEYEYGGVPGEMYFRPSMEDVFYEATKFDGHAGLDFLMNEISENGTFLYGFPVACGTETYNCEIFDMGKYRQGVLLDASGLPYAGWKWLEGDTHLGDNENETICKEGLALMESIAVAEIDPEIDEYLDHARTHIGKTGEDPITKTQTALEWIKEDQKEQGLSDLTANVTKGDIYPESQVVQEYLDFFISHEPFKIELWSFSNFTMDHEVLTIDGMDFYHSSIVRSHDNSFDYDFIYIALGDYVYQGGQEGLRKYPKDSYFTQKEVDLQLPEGLTPTASHMPKFMTAYDATIDGEKYIVEEWGNKDKTITYFCKDGKIVGFSFMDKGHKIVYHVVDFEKKADASLLVVPE